MKIRNSLSRLGLESWLLIVVLTMTGCASGPLFQKIDNIPAGKAVVYIYRPVPTLMHGAGAAPHVVINDLNAIPLKTGGYYPYFSAPGEVIVSVTHNMIKNASKGSLLDIALVKIGRRQV